MAFLSDCFQDWLRHYAIHFVSRIRVLFLNKECETCSYREAEESHRREYFQLRQEASALQRWGCSAAGKIAESDHREVEMDEAG